MSLSVGCSNAFSEGLDYYEELIGPNIEIGKLVEKLDDIPKDYSYFEVDLVYKTYTKEYTGLKNIGGYETYYTRISNKKQKGYHMLSPDQYKIYVSGFEVVDRDEYMKFCRESN